MNYELNIFLTDCKRQTHLNVMWCSIVFYIKSLHPKCEVRVHKTSLTPLLFNEVAVLCRAIGRSSICVLRGSILPLYTFFLVDIGAVPIVWYFLFSILFINLLKRDFIFSAKTKTNVSSQLVYCIK